MRKRDEKLKKQFQEALESPLPWDAYETRRREIFTADEIKQAEDRLQSMGTK